MTDACYQQLRSFKRTLSQQPDADPADLFAERCDAYRAKLEADKTAGALLPDEAAARTRTLALLTAWSRSLDNGLDADEAFDTVRGAFYTQVQRREEAVSAASNALEFAFDFMEQAFEDGQEMVVFVNELALGPDSAPFLAENDCERFEQYSEKLLLHGGEDELLESGLDEMLDEHSVSAIEWHERAPGLLPEDCLEIRLTPLDGEQREIAIVPHGAFRALDWAAIGCAAGEEP